ncbi:TonB family protein [Caulobacter segnis]|uniref:TonB family protein n=1 Tax=Caulobacter segnis TaxID=88688 RepID=UPI001CBFCE6F|nr:TonB family protein [Caulobacter segnis]UAL10717.1 energy transducer TonB [Caulobacter segnis]
MTTAADQTPTPRPAVMGPYRPDWLEKPTVEDMSRYYPDHAARHDISGRAMMACDVRADGRLDRCEIRDETPAGEGFGQAALRIAPKFRMIPPDDPNARPAKVVVPLVFKASAHRATSLQPETERELRILANLGVRLAVGGGLLLVFVLMVAGRYRLTAQRWSREP